MSPEQARGAPVDYRTDQFSFGVTLYEMVTGRRAFQADTPAQTLAAIIEDEPESIAKLNSRVPAPLRWVIERCLAKDPRQRYDVDDRSLARAVHATRSAWGVLAGGRSGGPRREPSPPARCGAADRRGGPAVAIGAIVLRGR
jgi:serine/threonine protein kinase